MEAAYPQQLLYYRGSIGSLTVVYRLYMRAPPPRPSPPQPSLTHP